MQEPAILFIHIYKAGGSAVYQLLRDYAARHRIPFLDYTTWIRKQRGLETGGGELELTKMGVSEAARGRKVGEKLLRRAIYEAFRSGAHELYLLTASKCEAAVHLYLKNGFVHSTEVMRRFGSRYQRCDVAMIYRR